MKVYIFPLSGILTITLLLISALVLANFGNSLGFVNLKNSFGLSPDSNSSMEGNLLTTEEEGKISNSSNITFAAIDPIKREDQVTALYTMKLLSLNDLFQSQQDNSVDLENKEDLSSRENLTVISKLNDHFSDDMQKVFTSGNTSSALQKEVPQPEKIAEPNCTMVQQTIHSISEDTNATKFHKLLTHLVSEGEKIMIKQESNNVNEMENNLGNAQVKGHKNNNGVGKTLFENNLVENEMKVYPENKKHVDSESNTEILDIEKRFNFHVD